jgi:hypothetical protein
LRIRWKGLYLNDGDAGRLTARRIIADDLVPHKVLDAVDLCPAQPPAEGGVPRQGRRVWGLGLRRPRRSAGHRLACTAGDLLPPAAAVARAARPQQPPGRRVQLRRSPCHGLARPLPALARHWDEHNRGGRPAHIHPRARPACVRCSPVAIRREAEKRHGGASLPAAVGTHL